MKQRVSLKLLILFGITCTTFMLAGSRLHAADVIENKSSTFSTQLNNRTDSTSNDSAIAEKIRAQRAAIDARDNRNTATAQIKSSATQNSCDNDLRKCINNTCGANYKKCETDSDTTFSDKLNACRKNTTCTAHEFTLFTNEIKEDKKQAISLALYNDVLDCGNSYNDCIIQQCGPKFNKCLAKSAGDKAINACKTIAQNCTEADSGLVGRVGNVFGIVRVDAEKQIKTDEAKLQSLRDQMRNSCRTLGALFDDRSLDCVFTANFFAGDDKTHPMASKKLYAGSLFDCTPDWFGIDITTFKENAYRATRAQSAASAAMLGSGVGTAVGALTSGAISRAIDTKKAKDALEDACTQEGKKLEDGKCVEMTPEEKCKAQGGKWKNNQCEQNNDNNTNEEEEAEEENNDNDTKSAENGGGSDSASAQQCTPEQRSHVMHAREVKLQDGKCIPVSCDPGYTISDITGQCEEQEEDEDQLCLPNELKELNATFGNKNTGKCIPTKCMEQYELSGNKCKKMSDKDICEKISMGTWKNKKCQCDDKTQNMVNGKCVDDDKKIELKRSSDDAMANIQASIDKESQKQVQACTDSGGTWDDKKKSPCSCSKQKGLTDDIKGFTCKCQMNGYEYDKQSNKCTKQTSSNNNNNNNNKQSASATNKDTEASTQAKIDELRQQRHKQQCEKTGGTWEGEGCSCYTSKGITPESSYTCKCIKTGYIFQNGKCTKQTSSNNTTNQQSASATNKDTEDELLQQLRDNQKKHCKETGGTWDNNKCIKKSSTTTTQQAVKTRPMTKEEALEQTLSMTAANQSMMYLNSINETKSFCDVANKKCGFVYVNQNTERGALFCCKVDKIEQTNDGYSIQGQECQVRMFANIKDPNKFANKYSIASCSPQEFPDLY